MNILILTDSLSLPRAYGDQFVALEETYPELLRIAYPQLKIVSVAIGGGTIVDLYDQLFYYRVVQPDLVILQSGIVDCAPRAFRKTEQKIITKFRLRPFVKPCIKFLRKYRCYRYTRPKKFDLYLKKYRTLLDSTRTHVFAIGILPASGAYERLVPGITKSIELYNRMLRDNTNFISMDDIPMEGILGDHHHLNKKGHKYTFERIKGMLEKEYPNLFS